MKWVSIFLVSSACILSSCNSEKDIYDPNYNSKLNVTIPEGFEWSTTQKVTVNVEVNDEYDGKYYYAVRVYDKAPAEGVLPVAASGEVTGDMPFSQDVVIPATVSKLYIAQVFKNANASEVVTMKEVAINGPVIDCSFGASSKSRSIVSSRGDSYSNYTELTGDAKIEKGEKKENKKYIIKAGQTYNLQSDVEDVDLVVLGTLQLSRDVTFTRSNLKIEKGNIEGKNYILTFDGKEGVKDEDESYSFDNEGNIYLKGLLVSGRAELENEKYIEVGTLTLEQNSELDNDEENGDGGCIIATTVNIHTKNSVELDKKSFLSCEEMNINTASNSTVIEMETGSWLKVGTFSINGNQKCKIKSDGGNITDSEYVALAQINKINASGLSTDEGILVECSEVVSGAEIKSRVDDANGMIKIVGTSCSGSFGDEEKTGTPLCTYALEDVDINEGDYDMNDIVVAVTSTIYSPAKKTWTIKGEVLAAGATNALVPYFQYGKDGEKTYLFENKRNVYEAFGLTGSPVPVNTIIDGTKADNIIFEIVLPNIEAVSPQLSMLNFGIEVNGQEETISWLENGTGANARAIQIAALFKYPIEKKRITEAYPDFNKWISTAKEEGKAWYDNPNDNYVITPQLSTKTN